MAFEEVTHKVIDKLQFGMFSPQELRRFSVAEIQTADTYDEDGAPIISGLMDGRLGTLEPRQRCKTCGNTAIRCPGHFGHIELAVPAIHIIFSKIIHKLLRSTCRNCGRVTLPEEQIAKIRKQIERSKSLLGGVPASIYKAVLKDAKQKQCPYCGTPQHKIVFEKPTRFREEAPEEGSHQLTPSMIRERLERI
ncbi:DNA-directed RNA polymerase subunit A'/A'', partial [Candidatus Bathyarchaeota archaeon]|nr:DNA-directed RNA polymerase subunit A'/A'' [Candidatus Bathyarchaeota archaeon]